MYPHRAWIEISLPAVAENLKVIKALAPDQEIMAVLKADAYGLGAIALATFLETKGVALVGVGDSHEALLLREAGYGGDLLILGALLDGEVERTLAHGIIASVHSQEKVQHLNRLAETLNRKARVHLKVDTGLTRLGCSLSKAPLVLKEIIEAPFLELDGLSTHFADAWNNPEFSRLQIDRFQNFLEHAKKLGTPARIHASSSGALFNEAMPGCNTVRPGLSLYGIKSGSSEKARDLKPALALKTQIIFIRDVEKGTPIGYEGSYLCPQNTRLAVLPIGYNDGYDLRLSGKAEVLVKGCRAPTRGRISMDYTTIEIGHIPDVHVGDEVVLIGKQKGEEVSLECVASWASGIPHQLLCNLGKRVRRVYLHK